MAANPNPLAAKSQWPKVPFTATPPKGRLPWYGVPIHFRQVALMLTGAEKDVLIYLLEMQYGVKRQPSAPDPSCTEPTSIEAIAKECECAKSAAQAAIRLFVEISLVSTVTPAEARRRGLQVKGTRTLRYTCLCDNWPNITAEMVEEARERLEPEAEEPEVVEPQAEEPEAGNEASPVAKVGTPFLVPAGRSVPHGKLRDGREAVSKNSTLYPQMVVFRETEKQVSFEVIAHSEGVKDRQIPAGRYMSPGPVPVSDDVAALIQRAMRNIESPINRPDAQKIADILQRSQVGAVDPEWFIAEHLKMRAAKAARKRERLGFAVLELLAKDVAADFWPQELERRREFRVPQNRPQRRELTREERINELKLLIENGEQWAKQKKLPPDTLREMNELTAAYRLQLAEIEQGEA